MGPLGLDTRWTCSECVELFVHRSTFFFFIYKVNSVPGVGLELMSLTLYQLSQLGAPMTVAYKSPIKD